MDFLWHWITPLQLLLFIGACAGHTALQVYGLNYFLGWPTSRRLSRVVRHSNTVMVFAVPLLVWWLFALGLDNLRSCVLGWTLLCVLSVFWLVGFVIAPMVAVVYWWRRGSLALLNNHSEIVDVAKQLGYRPYGRGKRRAFAKLPYNQLFEVEFAERHFAIADLPQAWDGLTILQLSDLHLRGVPDKVFYQHVIDRCNKWEPDLVAVTGDIVDSYKHHRWIIPVLGRLRWKVAAFAILGNHDQWFDPTLIRRRLRKLGMNVLGNGWQQIDVRGEPMTVIGHEGPWFPPAPDLTGCPEGFRLCLSHTPDNIAWAKSNHINLMLSGHCHGGQIRFPLIGSVYVPSKYGRRYDCGSFDEDPTLLHVSRGLAGQHPVRYGCRPEATLLVLHRKT